MTKLNLPMLRQSETFKSGMIARARARALQSNEQIENVKINRSNGRFEIQFFVTKKYFELNQKYGYSF